MKRFFVIPVIASAVFFRIGIAASEENHWLIPIEKAECIIEHAAGYAEQGADPVVIIVDACPEINMAAALTSTAMNTGTTTIGQGDSVLIFSQAELKCLTKLEFEPNEQGLVKISKALSCG